MTIYFRSSKNRQNTIKNGGKEYLSYDSLVHEKRTKNPEWIARLDSAYKLRWSIGAKTHHRHPFREIVSGCFAKAPIIRKRIMHATYSWNVSLHSKKSKICFRRSCSLEVRILARYTIVRNYDVEACMCECNMKVVRA